jgi:hypothetical protein
MDRKLKRIRQIVVILFIAAAVAGISSCEKYAIIFPQVNPVDTIYFQTDIQPIFTANCLSCHGAIQQPILKAGVAYQNLLDREAITPPGETSKLYVRITSPDHVAKTTDAEKQKILIWINQGAMNNKK